LLPFLLLLLIFVHVLFLHDQGSSNPLLIKTLKDKIMFNPYYTIKDLYTTIIAIMLLLLFLGFYPNYLGHSDNYIMANPLVTPTHIVPEWYFLPFYAILRSIPNKLGGILVLALAIVTLLCLPYCTSFKTCISGFNSFRFFQKLWFWSFILLYIFLGWLGGNPVEDPYLLIGQVLTCGYFIYMYVVINILLCIDSIVFIPSFWEKDLIGFLWKVSYVLNHFLIFAASYLLLKTDK